MSRGEDNDILMISVVSLSRDVEIYLSAVFFCLAAALPHHNTPITGDNILKFWLKVGL